MIDILLSTYNGADFVRDFIISLGAQTIPDLRLLVRDDGSGDATVGIVRDAAAAAGLRAEFLSSSGRHLGAVHSFGEILKNSSAEYVLFADQDDVWHSDKVAEMTAAMRAAEARYGAATPLLLHSDLRVCDASGAPVAASFVRRTRLSPGADDLVTLLVQNDVTGCAMMINRALRERVRLPFPEEIISHDWYLALIAAAVGRIVFVDRALVDYREHGGNVFGAPEYTARSCLKAFFRGRAELKRRLALTQLQAGAFLRQYGDVLDGSGREAVGAWSKIGGSSKLGRIAICLKYHFRKNTLPRTIGMWWAI